VPEDVVQIPGHALPFAGDGESGDLLVGPLQRADGVQQA
jgi:hypothetical protein